MKIRVACVDDNPDLLRLYKRLLDRCPDTECVGCFVSTRDLQSKLQDLQADVLLLDLTIPGERVIDKLADLLAARESLACLVISRHADPVAVRDAINAGALGCIHRDGSGATIVQAVREVYSAVNPTPVA